MTPLVKSLYKKKASVNLCLGVSALASVDFLSTGRLFSCWPLHFFLEDVFWENKALTVILPCYRNFPMTHLIMMTHVQHPKVGTQYAAAVTFWYRAQTSASFPNLVSNRQPSHIYSASKIATANSLKRTEALSVLHSGRISLLGLEPIHNFKCLFTVAYNRVLFRSKVVLCRRAPLFPVLHLRARNK